MRFRDEVCGVQWQGDFDCVANVGQSAEIVHEQTGHGFVISFREPLIDQALRFVDMELSGQYPAIGPLGDLQIGRVVLVGDLTDQLLGDVFNGDDSGEAAVLIDYQGHLVIGFTQLFERRLQRQR